MGWLSRFLGRAAPTRFANGERVLWQGRGARVAGRRDRYVEIALDSDGSIVLASEKDLARTLPHDEAAALLAILMDTTVETRSRTAVHRALSSLADPVSALPRTERARMLRAFYALPIEHGLAEEGAMSALEQPLLHEIAAALARPRLLDELRAAHARPPRTDADHAIVELAAGSPVVVAAGETLWAGVARAGHYVARITELGTCHEERDVGLALVHESCAPDARGARIAIPRRGDDEGPQVLSVSAPDHVDALRASIVESLGWSDDEQTGGVAIETRCEIVEIVSSDGALDAVHVRPHVRA